MVQIACSDAGAFLQLRKTFRNVDENEIKRAVEKTDVMLQEFRDEGKRTGCTIMPDGWTDKKKAFNL